MKTARQALLRRPGIFRGVIGVVVVLLAGCANPPPAPSIGADDLRQVSNLAACYTEGIDALGAGKVDAGTAIWSRCFTEDVRFSLSFGAFSVTCPGDKCPLPASMTGLARRVALARGTFERAGYVMTSHHVTSLGIERVDASTIRVKGHLQAWHFRKDGTAVVGLGTWEIDARQTPAGWRIAEERLDSPLRVVVPKAE
jgi:3-phenylpropionate/cinnamic acid dioxygenase small subunit